MNSPPHVHGKPPSPEIGEFAVKLLAELMAEHPLGRVPEIHWRSLRVTAGLAYHREHRIALSRLVLTDRERLEETLRHEYAHLLAVARHGPSAAGHGPEWRQAMRDLGQEPKVHHSYEVRRNRPRQQVAYRCERCGCLIFRARRLPRRRRYVHVGCGGRIRFAWARPVTESGQGP
ncbi:MAG: SprT-like domain-containing protein [Fimbriimonadaceae bacterium]